MTRATIDQKLEQAAEELRFDVELSWSGTGRDGVGVIAGEDVATEYSVPASMNGRGAGTNPEELLVSAVGACYSATLQGVLQRRGLPSDSVRVAASGSVTGYPGHARFARLTVSPTICGADPTRLGDYRRAAEAAHERCFIGHTLASSVEYRLGRVSLADEGGAS
jgi:osmotically inducible protein OsmC